MIFRWTKWIWCPQKYYPDSRYFFCPDNQITRRNVGRTIHRTFWNKLSSSSFSIYHLYIGGETTKLHCFLSRLTVMVRLIVLLSICTFLFGNANHVEARQEPLIPNLPDLSVATDQPFHPTWNCTIRGWVRAPDLSPVSSTPGEARLAANGSQCGDIASWAVGLRFKERAIAKLR